MQRSTATRCLPRLEDVSQLLGIGIVGKASRKQQEKDFGLGYVALSCNFSRARDRGERHTSLAVPVDLAQQIAECPLLNLQWQPREATRREIPAIMPLVLTRPLAAAIQKRINSLYTRTPNDASGTAAS